MWMPSRHSDPTGPRIRIYLDKTLTISWYRDYEAQGIPVLTVGRDAVRRALGRGIGPDRALAEALAAYLRAGAFYRPLVKDLLPGAAEFMARNQELEALSDEN